MRPNPIADVWAFLTKPDWPTPVYWLLLVASVLVAVAVWRRDPDQQSPRRIGLGLLRVLIGAMWWQQSLWKIPPNYDGLTYYLKEMIDHAAVMLQSTLVRDIVLPNIGLFGPLVYLLEVAIGVSLTLGLLTRASGVLGVLMALNLWLGLYSAPGEWPWTYFFLVVIQCWFVIDPPGFSLGLDALVARRSMRTRVVAA
ncbi:MAG TPA: hypothetical protein VHS58_01960 [Acetobacteraceae bacterium]|jgi:uncharacterized membrane protein YphA (DoxX/SURF4 family)|nr:hypothetical protein [Acetobacteraceae bacterium]